MTKIAIYVNVEPEHADDDHAMGITTEAYERLTDPMRPPLGWLGEVEDVEQVDE